MKKAELWMSANEPEQLSSIFLEGRRCRNPRLNMYMIGRHISEWTAPNISRFLVWKGVLQELSGVLNTRNFTLRFVGTPSAYTRFTALLDSTEPSGFHVTLEFEQLHYDADSSLGEWLGSLIQVAENRYLLRRLRILSTVLDFVNLNVVYEERNAANVLLLMPYPFFRLYRTDELEVCMPLVMITEEESWGKLEDIYRLHSLNHADTMVLAVGGSLEQLDKLAGQFHSAQPDVAFFALTGNEAEDTQTIVRIKNFYRPFLYRKLREFVRNQPPEYWKPDAVKLLAYENCMDR